MTTASESLRRRWPLYLGGLLVALLAWSAISAHGGTPEPTAGDHLSHGAVVVEAASSFPRGARGDPRARRRHRLVVGAPRSTAVRSRSALAGFLASVATWFLASWVLGQLARADLAVQAATGLLAVIVLLVIMNWFFHKVYWTGWIPNHNRRKRESSPAAEKSPSGRRSGR